MGADAESQVAEVVKVGVEAANDRGIKYLGEWHNWSKWAKERPAVQKGDIIAVHLDKDGFIRRVEGGRPPATVAPPAAGGYGRSPETERHIARQVAVKAAVDFLTAQMAARATVQAAHIRAGTAPPETAPIKADHITQLADRVAAWILEPPAGASERGEEAR